MNPLPYTPLRQADTLSLPEIGTGYAVRRWGDPARPAVWLLHGWMDVGASFQFLIDALPAALFDAHAWYAPDWRGFGDSGRGGRSYWFPDYLADLDALLESVTPGGPVTLIGHSMGGIVAMLYAGVRPERVGGLVSLEGFGLPATQAAQAPGRLRQWLEGLAEPPQHRPYPDLDSLVRHLCQQHARLGEPRARFVAAQLAARDEHGWRLKADARHRLVNPILFRLEEHLATWQRITAPVLWLQGGDGWVERFLKVDAAALAQRAAMVARLTRVELPDCGHHLHWECPERAADAIAAWWGNRDGASAL